ncbi:MAG: hypothetical protein EOO00_02070 [Chitinophagaceae bacterium]|nr:MAG: hypothetical protein EOO00_02070 [Chitinophagaceae bacterium]
MMITIQYAGNLVHPFSQEKKGNGWCCRTWADLYPFVITLAVTAGIIFTRDFLFDNDRQVRPGGLIIIDNT